MTADLSSAASAEVVPDTARGPLARRWVRRAFAASLVYVAAAVLLPWVLDASAPWRAFGAGLVLPGAGLLYAIPNTHHAFGVAMVIGHAIIVGLELAMIAWTLRSKVGLAATVLLVGVGLLVWGCVSAPVAVVVAGHVAGFIGVLVACGWAVGIRLSGRADSFTLVAIVVVSAAVGAGLTAWHGDMPGHHDIGGPMTWIPWASLAVALGGLAAGFGYSGARDRRARRVGEERARHFESISVEDATSAQTAPPTLDRLPSAPDVTEASAHEVQLMRYLMSVAAQPVDDWAAFDDEAAGPLQQYRYQVNALGWALAMYQYSHAPAYGGALTSAQLQLVERAQQKPVWGYWYWQNLLGNWDFLRRRADPIDVPQNIMFTGYLNLQLAMFRQACGESSFDAADSLVFDWSPRQRFAFTHQQVNSIAIRNFDQDLCLWPCEPVLSPGRKRGFVFPYCNAVTTAGIAMMDTVNGTDTATEIAARTELMLQREFTLGGTDLVAFLISGLGLRVRSVMVGPTVTATIAALLAPLCPDLAWRAWETLRREWLETGDYRIPGSAGGELPDWATNAKTNTAPLAGAMLLADSCGEREWHQELWNTAVEQLHFETDSAGMGRFTEGSVYGNGMLGFAGFGRPLAFRDMLTAPRPTAWQNGPRLQNAPHPDVLVAKAVTDGAALDLVLRPSAQGARVHLEFDRLRPGHRYYVHGSSESELIADATGRARATVELHGRTAVEVRPS